MGAFAIYRLPYQTECTLVLQRDGDPDELSSAFELNDRCGYVLAPFAVTTDEPLLLIHPDQTAHIRLFAGDQSQAETLTAEHLNTLCPDFISVAEELLPRPEENAADAERLLQEEKTVRMRYHIDFASFHSHLQSGEFQKIVLSRCSHLPLRGDVSPLQLFQKACEHYPRMFVSLVSTRRSGTWLMATPEILLEGCGRQWRTIALAGTMPVPDQQSEQKWSTKDIQEQRFVATYVTECLEHFLLGDKNDDRHDISEDGPYTTQAANVLHLRSDFKFTMPEHGRVGSLLQRLHPTPAICGLPKQQTFDFIQRNESAPRHYYSGYGGPLHLDDATHLFVSLRCMRIAPDGCHLYAGGGLLRDSEEQLEWQETESKMEAMRNLLDNA